ncbi:protein of unknown function [Pseudonocardia ammonioxydans]|uniref:DUF4192 domain-containing protein n=1 Tax=Pseudonocardia ammonioxydans TaxID=260086 RepID=A0A1I5GUR5_PSUAM|nr:DUF4192 domain-containing protein [Pseudonocardia ammonioxydans]SFO39679.1 protein of unknown function [Pseudonocardia ammonioxydans]
MTTPSSVRITSPGDLVAMVACTLTFHPSESLVLVSFAGGSTRMGPVLRTDLPGVGEIESATAEAVRALPAEYRHSALLVVVSRDPREDVFRDARLVLTAAGVKVTGAIHTTGTRSGDRWRCLDHGCGDAGTVPEPHPTVAAHMAWTEQVMLPDREAIEQTLTPVDGVTLARRAQLLTKHTTLTTGVPASLAATVAEYHARHQLDDELVVRLIAALTDQRAVVEQLREHTSQIRVVLESLVRETPAPWSAKPAAYLALAALLHGDGAHASVAAERATTADPAALLPRLVSEVAASAATPDTIRGLLTRF